jgi:hypothetical protein
VLAVLGLTSALLSLAVFSNAVVAAGVEAQRVAQAVQAWAVQVALMA